MDNCHLGNPMTYREGKPHEPVAAKTRLGWIVYGSYPTNTGNGANGFLNHHSPQVCPCVDSTDDRIDIELKKYFAIDSMGITKSPHPVGSKDDEKALEILATTTHLKGNRYETGLLWKYSNVQLPPSKLMAIRRFECLQRKMQKDPVLRAAIIDKMNDYETKGYIRRLTPSEIADKRNTDWFLPTFPVTNPNKPGKIRIVFDAAAKSNGVSLNTFLLKGPDQLVDLLTVLYKFREHRIGVVGDIKEMFFQVAMRPEDQRSQMILWNGGETDKAPDVYVVTVMTFGAACSPCCAHYVKNLNAEKYRDEFPRAFECIVKEHYVDDMLASVETEDEAIKLAKDVRHVHAKGGFEIRNWLSNSHLVMEQLDVPVKIEKDVNVGTDTRTEKVLGMWWDTQADTFTYKVSPRNDEQLLAGAKLPTKREVLRILMRIYDPLGLLGNVLMFLKVLLQEIWRAGVGWDEQIGGRLAEQWERWTSILPAVCQIKIPRCYRQRTSALPGNVQLHIFCDASENGMAAVAYFRIAGSSDWRTARTYDTQITSFNNHKNNLLVGLKGRHLLVTFRSQTIQSIRGLQSRRNLRVDQSRRLAVDINEGQCGRRWYEMGKNTRFKHQQQMAQGSELSMAAGERLASFTDTTR
ncbi:uncharacterized protein LOC121600475 [Anopheles merus]|uniref:uncharacterized protein LOC121600475 n=1 Tax=Anopheles merus TaxID=30066 RepID=UPI001BE48015|nr:uncharacterized protein LOC121600475 [Anopheles merus]